MKKDEFTIWDYLHGLFWAILIAILVVPLCAVFSNPPSRSLTTWLLLAYIALDITLAIMYRVLTIPSDKRIISKLKKAGYECGLHEGKIYFKKNNCNWTICTYSISKHYRRIVFYLRFNAEDLDRDPPLANKIVCIVGQRNPDVVTNWNGKNAVRFIYFTVFSSTKDILREFESATYAISSTVLEFNEFKESAFGEANHAAEHKVGFQYGDQTESESKDIRANKETETTN